MITINHITKSFGSLKAVSDLHLDIQDGEIFGFLGPNGAGKTTTLKMITGILSPDSGSIAINGKNIQAEPIEAKMQFGFVPDDPNVFPRLKGIEYLGFIGDVYDVPKETRSQIITSLAAEFEMSTALADRISTYSHGMRQKIVLMGALLHNPPVWILDEPMTGLDPKSSFTLKNMMRKHADTGHTVLFSTHVLDVAERICDRIGIINQGELVFVGTMPEIKAHFAANTSLEEMFIELTANNNSVAGV